MELFIIRDGQQTGPFSHETVQDLLNKGGLRPDDLGWHKGLPAWLPLAEVLEPAAQRRTEPPPVNGASSGIRQRPASARQKALLQYLGAPVSEKATREEAAVAISDALENPKLTSRFSKWGEEKLRLHPDLYQEEIDFRRANRITRYLELCQTEGAEVVKDITKAHVQVLMESLDKKQVGWDEDPKAAVWGYLFPSVEEHFPQLVQDEWKGKLRYGGTSKVAAAYAGIPATGVLVSSPPAPSAFQAALRGVVYGLVALGAVIAGIYLFKDNGKNDVARNDAKAATQQPAASALAGTAPVEAAAPPAGEAPAPATTTVSDPTKAPLIGATPENVPGTSATAPSPVPAVEPAAAPAPGAPDGEKAVAAAPAPAEPATASGQPSAPLPTMNTAAFTPAPPPPGSDPSMASKPAEAPAAPATPGPAVRNSATLTQAVTVQLQFGKVTLPAGTKLRLIALEGANARVNFNNNVLLVPVVVTDIDPANTVVAAAATLPTVAPVAPVAASVPSPAAPAATTQPKSSPLSDL